MRDELALLKKAEKALEAFGNEANAWEEMGETRPIMGPDSPLTVAHLNEARQALLDIRKFLLRNTQCKVVVECTLRNSTEEQLIGYLKHTMNKNAWITDVKVNKHE